MEQSGIQKPMINSIFIGTKIVYEKSLLRRNTKIANTGIKDNTGKKNPTRNEEINLKMTPKNK